MVLGVKEGRTGLVERTSSVTVGSGDVDVYSPSVLVVCCLSVEKCFTPVVSPEVTRVVRLVPCSVDCGDVLLEGNSGEITSGVE